MKLYQLIQVEGCLVHTSQLIDFHSQFSSSYNGQDQESLFSVADLQISALLMCLLRLERHGGNCDMVEIAVG